MVEPQPPGEVRPCLAILQPARRVKGLSQDRDGVAMCRRQRCRLCGEDTSVHAWSWTWCRRWRAGTRLRRRPRPWRRVGSTGLNLAGGRGRPADSRAVPADQTVIRWRGRSNCHSVQMVDDEGVSREHEAGQVADLPTGTVVGAGGYAVGNIGGELFAVSRRCRHLGADLANGTLDEEGHLVCPWHRSAYDVHTGRMVRGPQACSRRCPGWMPLTGR
jgi:nitrite reductase/ring-hydroxylating ferredoxin subunit